MNAILFALILSLILNVLLVRFCCVLTKMVKEAEADAKAAWAELDAHNDRP